MNGRGYLSGVIDKSMDADARVISGWASTPALDREGDTIEPSAFAGSLGSRLKVLFNHQQDLPIGKIVRAEIQEAGLWIEAKLASGTAKADEVWSLISQGILDSFSVGFVPTEWENISKTGSTGPRRYTKAELLEVSVVTIPANPHAVMDGTSMGAEAIVARHLAESATDWAQQLDATKDKYLHRVVTRMVDERLAERDRLEALGSIDWSLRS